MTLRRLRTIDEAYQELLKEDSNTAITKYWIRKLCKEKKIQCINLGAKTLLDYDDLIDKINSLISSE